MKVFYLFIADFYAVGIWFHSSTWDTVSPALFIEDSLFSSVYFWKFCQNQVAITECIFSLSLLFHGSMYLFFCFSFCQ